MSTTKIPLSMVTIASPCSVPWEDMKGDDKVRFCGQCSLHVYNLSALSYNEAESLVNAKEGKMCARFFKRFDGTALTQDCPVGWRALKQRVAIAGGVAAAVLVSILVLFTGGLIAGVAHANGGARLRNPIEIIQDWLFPPAIAGGICRPPIAPPPPAPPVPINEN